MPEWHSEDSLNEKRPVYQHVRLISSFDAAQKEARTLLHTLQQKDAMSTERYASFYGTEVFPPRLSDAQYLVARRYGFKSWTTLKAHLTSRLTRKRWAKT